MKVVLQAEDATEWSYRGEGAANLVLYYSGNSSDFIGKVLRIQKVPRNNADHEDDYSGLNKLECILWRDYQDLVLAPSREVAERLYVKHVMCPLLGPDHIDVGVPIYVSREFLEAVESHVLCQRPSWRVDAAKVNDLCDSVLLISDHSVFPRRTIKEELNISIELKPKCGFLPNSNFIAKGNDIKKTVTRFRMHQALKLCQGEVMLETHPVAECLSAYECFFRLDMLPTPFMMLVAAGYRQNEFSLFSHSFLPVQFQISQISEYNPLDLFSGSKSRVHKAINNLFVTPQNNFRVFLNGSLVFGGLGGGTEKTSCVVGEAFEEALKHVILADDGMRTKCFLELVADAVFKSELLDQLLKVQKLDIVDIEGAIHAYYDIIAQPCVVCRNMSESELSKRCNMLHSIPSDESLKIVRDYLISATAKDLSIIISFRPNENDDPESPHEVVFLQPTEQSFDCKASFIDLDMKPLRRMEYYYKLDQQIVSFYAQNLEVDQFEDVATIKGISH